MTKGKIDRRTVIKTLGTAAATAALGTAGAPRVVGEPLPAAESSPQAQDSGSSTGISGGRYMADFFNAYGVTAIFHLPQGIGGCLGSIEIAGYPIKRVLTHGEKASGYMADGYGRVSGRPGICAAQGAGAGNQAPGLRDAYMAGTPMIAITGQEEPPAKYKKP
ncbi:MAG: thiamine pyrophosphate-binding protein, partial [Acidobacteriota bacterium]